jgi:molybdopterin-guanine dinucleotide biosynthesis protein B
VGRKNHGKTTLMLRLVRELTLRGYRVGTIKHTRHVHDLDAPGTDSYRHRDAGGAPAAIVTGDLTGIFLPCDPGADVYERLAPLYAACDLILVEGDLDSPGPKIEVWRAALGTPCLAAERPDIALVVTDDPLPEGIPTLSPRQLDGLLERIFSLVATIGAVRR